MPMICSCAKGSQNATFLSSRVISLSSTNVFNCTCPFCSSCNISYSICCLAMSLVAIFCQDGDASLENMLKEGNVIIKLSSSWWTVFCLPFVDSLWTDASSRLTLYISFVCDCLGDVSNVTSLLPGPIKSFLALVSVNLVKLKGCPLHQFSSTSARSWRIYDLVIKALQYFYNYKCTGLIA